MVRGEFTHLKTGSASMVSEVQLSPPWSRNRSQCFNFIQTVVQSRQEGLAMAPAGLAMPGWCDGEEVGELIRG